MPGKRHNQNHFFLKSEEPIVKKLKVEETVLESIIEEPKSEVSSKETVLESIIEESKSEVPSEETKEKSQDEIKEEPKSEVSSEEIKGKSQLKIIVDEELYVETIVGSDKVKETKKEVKLSLFARLKRFFFGY